MPILIRCEHFAKKLNVPDAALGRRVRCPNCSGVCEVREPSAPVVEAPVPAAVEEPFLPPAATGRPAPRMPAPANGRTAEEVEEPFLPDEEDRPAPRKLAKAKRRPADERDEPFEAEVGDEPAFSPDEERIAARKSSPAKRRSREDLEEEYDDDRYDDDREEARPRRGRRLVLWLVLLILALLGAGGAVYLGMLWLSPGK